MLKKLRKKIIVVEGTIDHLGVSTYDRGCRTYTFIKVDGQMYKNVVVSQFLDSFISAGKTVRLAMVNNVSKHVIQAMQDEKGELYKDSGPFAYILLGLVTFFCGVIGSTGLALMTLSFFPYNLLPSAGLLIWSIYHSLTGPYLLAKALSALDAHEGVPPAPGIVAA
jgi:hypothetical protein